MGGITRRFAGFKDPIEKGLKRVSKAIIYLRVDMGG
jgi:hypothetical protein